MAARTIKDEDWTPEMDKLLGTMTDYEVGDELGCNKFSVRRRRQKLDIAAYGGFKWPKEVA